MSRAQGGTGGAWRHLGKVEREALTSHLDYLKESPAPDWAERRYAPGFFATAATGVTSDREEIIRRLKGEAGRAKPTRPASLEVVFEADRVLFRTSNTTVALDEFRAQAYGDVVTFSYRATNINRGGQLTGQSRVGGVYVKQGGRWRQAFGQTTEVIAHSTRP